MIRIESELKDAASVGTEVVRVHGRSMLPSLPPGTLVRLEPVAVQALQPGDVVALRSDRGAMALHRFCGLTSEGMLLTQGDRPAQPDAPWRAEALVGRLAAAQFMGEWRFPRPRVAALLAWTMAWRSQRLARRVRWLVAKCAWRPVASPSQTGNQVRGSKAEIKKQEPLRALALAVSPSPRFDVQRLGHEWVLHDQSTGDVHILNLTAGLVWDALDKGTPPEAVVESLSVLYPDVPREQLRLDVETATKRLTALRAAQQC